MTDNAPSKVPCNGCTLCCHGHTVVIHEPSGDKAEDYETHDTIHPASGQAIKVLKQKENGDCHYLGESGCTIYEKRPFWCRTYDCRKLVLTLPHKQRERLIGMGQYSRKIENQGRRIASTLTDPEVAQCCTQKKAIIEGRVVGHVVIGDGKPTG